MRDRKYPVMRCELASCRGGLNGCNGSECRNPAFDRVTAEQARQLYDLEVARPLVIVVATYRQFTFYRDHYRRYLRVIWGNSREAVQGLRDLDYTFHATDVRNTAFHDVMEILRCAVGSRCIKLSPQES